MRLGHDNTCKALHKNLNDINALFLCTKSFMMWISYRKYNLWHLKRLMKLTRVLWKMFLELERCSIGLASPWVPMGPRKVSPKNWTPFSSSSHHFSINFIHHCFKHCGVIKGNMAIWQGMCRLEYMYYISCSELYWDMVLKSTAGKHVLL